MSLKTYVISGLATVASAHMKMNNPVPFNKGVLDNAPLNADGSDFPCKVGYKYSYDDSPSNVYAQGSKQQLSFTGSAVHGGGSCQVSVTTDLKPTKNSVWKVIKSIEGGCPAKGQAGNLPANAAADDPYKYDFTIPSKLSSGNYTIAWTWFNKMGNREMYMNCAPMSVTGSAGSSGFLDTLPDMFVANIGNECGTMGSTDLKFPNPGNDLDNFQGSTTGSAMLVAPTGTGCQTGGGSRPQPNYGSPDAGNPLPSNDNAVQPSKPGPGGVFLDMPSSDPTPVPTTSTVGSGSNSTGSHEAGTPCSTEGLWNCIGGTSFQRCASGLWSTTQPVAPGTQCAPGESAAIQITRANSKRSPRRAQRFFA
ncbi:Chitin-binding, domain 3 [Drechmeria coniospora]|uniref:Chitin-binding, domain 3 n=1 Tax=Drechmeria coniospora TaxID=98403 RepID=A0A151GWQ0_DRECN|nr:Chitin-binding, domain 3 [Drechmeria coniospora]KYK61500.1 Chitin-binding, domain 3 [Drechmeria coniospora]